MGRSVSIPVKIVRPAGREPEPLVDEAGLAPDGAKSGSLTAPERASVGSGRAVPELADELEVWRERALRLQAEMDNYRKRQQRWAQDQIEAERQHLLGAFLQVVDDLDRALEAASAGQGGSYRGDGLRRGVELTRRGALQLLKKEGVEPVDLERQPFDPNWHEAVATIPRNGYEVDPHTVMQVLQPGYRVGDRLLRPAKVVVAV